MNQTKVASGLTVEELLMAVARNLPDRERQSFFGMGQRAVGKDVLSGFLPWEKQEELRRLKTSTLERKKTMDAIKEMFETAKRETLYPKFKATEWRDWPIDRDIIYTKTVDYQEAWRMRRVIEIGGHLITYPTRSECRQSLINWDDDNDANYDEDAGRIRRHYEDTDEGYQRLMRDFYAIFDTIGLNFIDEADFGEDSFERCLTERLDGTTNLIELLQDLEKQGKIRIFHIPRYYTDDNALKDLYAIPFESKQELEEFLQSSRVKGAPPETILKRSIYLEEEVVSQLLDSFQEGLDLTTVAVDLFYAIPTLSDKLKARIFDLAFCFMEKKTEKALKSMDLSYGLSWEHVAVDEKCSLIRHAVERGVLLPNYQERLQKLSAATRSYCHLFSGRVIRQHREEIANVGVLLDQLAGPHDPIQGVGLELLSSQIGGQRVYLDGQLVGHLFNARFSDQPTNGEVVAWVVSEVIDQCGIKGTQTRYIVYAWEKNDSEIRQIFSDHAYTIERDLMVYPPTVDEDGTIRIKVRGGDQEEVTRKL